MVVITGPPVADIKPLLQLGSTDSARARKGSPARPRENLVPRGERQQFSGCTDMISVTRRPRIEKKHALPFSPNDESTLLRPASGGESLTLRGRAENISESIDTSPPNFPGRVAVGPSAAHSAETQTFRSATGREEVCCRGKIPHESTCATDTQVRQSGEGDRRPPSCAIAGQNLPPRRQTPTQLLFAGGGRQSSSISPPRPVRGKASMTSDIQPSASPSCNSRTRQEHSTRPARGSWLVTPPSCGPRSPARPAIGLPLAARAPTAPSRGSETRTIQIGIESEFLIASSTYEDWYPTLETFIKALADKYNTKVSKRHPRMRNTIRPYDYRGPFDKWCWVEEACLTPPGADGSKVEPCKPLPF